MASIVENFDTLNDRLLKELKFFEPGPVETIRFSDDPKFVSDYSKKLLDGKMRFAESYQTGYIDPLLKNFKDIIDVLKPNTPPDKVKDPKHYAYLTLLVNAALQPHQEQLAPYLDSIQGIVNEMYDSFLTARKNLNISTQLDQAIAPLVGFVGPLGLNFSKQAPLPSTFELEQMRELAWLGEFASEFKAGAIVIPAGYLKAPLLWGVLGHEVGGHYALTAGQGDELLRELRRKIYDKVLDVFPKQEELAALWLYWAEETAADVCGVLNLGPSFGIGAIHFYTAQLRLGEWSTETNILDAVFWNENRHPTPVLIPYVISGAIEGLTRLAPSRKFRYIAQIGEIARAKTREQNVLSFPNSQTLQDKEGGTVKLPQVLPMKLMQESARLVGSYITTVPLNALNGKSLQDLAMWDDDDEHAAIDVANQLMKPGTSSAIITRVDKPKKCQLLSGGILAVIRAPESYGRVNEILLKELGVNSTEAKKKR